MSSQSRVILVFNRFVPRQFVSERGNDFRKIKKGKVPTKTFLISTTPTRVEFSHLKRD